MGHTYAQTKLVAEAFTGMSVHTLLLNGGIDAVARDNRCSVAAVLRRAEAQKAMDDALMAVTMCDRRSRKRRASLEAAYIAARDAFNASCQAIWTEQDAA